MHKYGFQGNFWIVVVLLIFIEPFVQAREDGQSRAWHLDGNFEGRFIGRLLSFQLFLLFPPLCEQLYDFNEINKTVKHERS